MAQKVRAGEELNEANLKAFLQKNGLIEDANSNWEVSQFSTGFSNLTYLIQIENKEYVLRRPPNGAIKHGHDMGREYKVLTGLNKGFSKAPKAYAYTENVEVNGAPFYIMEKVDGHIITMKSALKLGLSEADFKLMSNTLLDTLVELHNLDYQSLGLGELGKPEGYVERQVRNWGKQYLKAATDDIPAAAFVMKWLEDNQPTEYGHSFIHNDYKYDNVVFDKNNWGNIQSILDWEMCTIGDPLMDFGTSICYWSIPTDNEMIRKSFPMPTELPGNPSREDLVQMYAEKSGRPVNHLVFYYAYGTFKLAVIVQQIYYRYAKGLTTDPRFAQLNHVTKLFLTMAYQAIKLGRIERLL